MARRASRVEPLTFSTFSLFHLPGPLTLAVVLLVGAGLFLTSFVSLMRINPGFDYRNVLTTCVDLPFERGDDLNDALRRGTPYMQSMLPTDLRVVAGALLTLIAAGLVASLLPARRAASVDPVIALRSQ